MATTDLDLGRYQLGWSDKEDYVFKPKKGLNESIVREMSEMKGEPEWMRTFRLRALKHFERKPMAPWFAERMPKLDFDDIYYYIKPTGGQVDDWADLPDAIKNTYEKLGIPEAERKYLSGVTAQYECLSPDTRVWTTSGMRRIKELGAGDEVFALNRDTKLLEVARVVAGGKSGEKEIFEITARGRTIGASGNHPFLVLRDERKEGARRARYAARWVPAEELAEGDLVAIATDVPEFGHNAPMLLPQDDRGAFYPRVTSDDMCWFLGLYLGDGYLKHSDGYTTVGIAVDKSDTVLVDEIRDVAKRLFGLDLTLSKDGYRLQARGTAALAEYLELNGLGGTSLTKRVPDWVFGLPMSQRLSFVAGLLDADGYVRSHPTTKDAVFTSANAELLAGIKELLALSGVWSSSVIPVTNRHPFDRERLMRAYRLQLSGRFDRIPARSPRRSERMARRYFFHTYRSAKNTVFHAHTSDMLGFARIEKVERKGVEPVYDIEVEGHHNFVAEGFVVHNSEVVFHRNREDLESQGVFFCDMDTAVREYPELVQKWFGKIIPPNDNKFAALNSAVWSGGSFIYVPPGVKVDMPLQAYFRINAENMGQFERTLIIADEGSQVHYIEGCSAPVYSTDSLHSAVVELVALPGSRITYTTIQNWSTNVYNLVTKRARAEAEAHVEWIDGNIGSRLTMKYPSVYLMGPKASGEVLSVAYAGAGQHQDAGAKMFHVAPETTSTIVSKSISKDGGITTYRGKVHVDPQAYGAKSFVRCDALLLDDDSTSETKPYMEVGERDARIGHEATVSKVGDDQLFYLMSRGLSEGQAMSMIVNGFIEPVTRTLPMEYAVEWSRLIELQMEGAVG
ncbi:MAG TPA: Fe-S cluster assembly protein SufB [Acidimicrobiales bacterium]|nr:Fe-S cluster assembly protein SufB [Acidimicrobiales bacterium]